MDKAIIKTPLGFATLEGDNLGIVKITITSNEFEVSTFIPNSLKDAVNQLVEYFDGKRTEFDLKLNPQGTDFQKKVWNELLRIPFGKTISYLELANKIGDIKAIRAVANANSKNPLWIVVPCHRVIGSNGSLIGYAGGLDRKKWLLDFENNNKQFSLF